MATTIGKLAAILSLDSRPYARGLKKSTESTTKFSRVVRRANDDVSRLGKLPAVALRGVAAFGALELGVKGLDATTEALNGNFEASAELIKKLPAGVGPFAQALESVLGKATGITAELESIERVTKAIEQSSAFQFDIAVRGAGSIETLDKSITELSRKVQLASAPPGQSEAVRQQIEAQRLVESVEAQIEAQRRRLRLTEKETKALADARAEVARLSDAIRKSRSRLESYALGPGGNVALALFGPNTRLNAGVNENAQRELTIQQGIIDGILARQSDATAAVDRQAERLRQLRDKLNALNLQPAAAVVDIATPGATAGRGPLSGALGFMEDLQARFRGEVASLRSFSVAITEQTRTPLERYEATIGKLSEALRVGFIDWDTYGRGVRMAQEQLEAFSEKADLGRRLDLSLSMDRVGALERGSVEALEVALAPRGHRTTRSIEDTAKNTGELVREAREQTRRLGERVGDSVRTKIVAF